MSKRSIVLVAAITCAIVLALTVAALGAGKTTGQTAGHGTSQFQSQCWDATYTGGFSWTDGSHSGHGWHTAHAPSEPCTAVQQVGGCDCGWCASGAAAIDAEWQAHGMDCSCEWCTAYHTDPPDVTTVSIHDSRCGCGWCYGHSLLPADRTQAAHIHGSGCCCGWCTPTLAQDDSTAGNSAHSKQSRGCCCGCC